MQGRSASSFSCSSAAVKPPWTSQYLRLASRLPPVYGTKPGCTEASLSISVSDVNEHTHTRTLAVVIFSVISINSLRLCFMGMFLLTVI